jgi:hypothetical protein
MSWKIEVEIMKIADFVECFCGVSLALLDFFSYHARKSIINELT